jgi:hypothetical protein
MHFLINTLLLMLLEYKAKDKGELSSQSKTLTIIYIIFI